MHICKVKQGDTMENILRCFDQFSETYVPPIDIFEHPNHSDTSHHSTAGELNIYWTIKSVVTFNLSFTLSFLNALAFSISCRIYLENAQKYEMIFAKVLPIESTYIGASLPSYPNVQ